MSFCSRFFITGAAGLTLFALCAQPLFRAAAIARSPPLVAALDPETSSHPPQPAELSAAQLARFEQIHGPTAAQRAALAAISASAGLVRFHDLTRELQLASDGRFALYFSEWGITAAAAGTPRWTSGSVGSYTQDGPWVVMKIEDNMRLHSWGSELAGHALGQRLARMPAGSSVDQALQAMELEVTEARRALGSPTGEPGRANAAEADAAATVAASTRWRYMRLNIEGGELLLPAAALPVLAHRWDGHGPLRIEFGALWSEGLAPNRAKTNPLGSDGFVLSQPLALSTPEPLRRLLRVEPVVARVIAPLEDPTQRDWSTGSSSARYQLDIGSQQGLFKGMALQAVSGEAFSMKVDSVEDNSAVGLLTLTRFFPTDPIAEPAPGQQFTSCPERAETPACRSAPPVPQRARITRVAPISAEADQGFRWYEVHIDRGRRQGLVLDDELLSEHSWVDGQAKVRSLGADSAVLIWRVPTGPLGTPRGTPKLPQVGQNAINKSWQLAARERVELVLAERKAAAAAAAAVDTLRGAEVDLEAE